MTRILVEKKEPFRLNERDMLLEIRDALNIPGITGVRLFNGYDVDEPVNIDKAKVALFSEAGQDIIYEGEPDIEGVEYVFSVAAAVGQYDQREDFVMQLLKIMEPQSEPVVRVFKMFALYGDITEADIHKIKTYYINPLEMREIPLTATKPRAYPDPDDVETIYGFSSSDGALLQELADKHGVAMALDNLQLCKEYFSKEQRDPTVTEMKVLDTYWSDHCRHSTFMTILENVKVDENEYTAGLKRAQDQYEKVWSYVYGDSQRPLCLMDIATMEMKRLKKSGDLDDMEKSDEVNACSIEVTVPVDGKPTDMIVMFKNETHNHPTEMEPFGGASTCLGGAIRDPLSGRAFAFGAIRLTGSGDPRECIEDTLPGKLPQRKITQTAADGYSSYGNGIGLALGQLIEVYDPGFKAKRMECGAIVAAAKKQDIFRGKPEPGDVVVLLGGNTGRDGCGGATGSSKEQNDDSLEKGGAEVQKGNPVIERNIVRLFRKPFVSKMIKTCNDFGAGGVCVAVGELADGLNIDLDKVPVKYPGLDGTELAISESQERMAIVLDAGDLDVFLSEAAAENLNAVKIAEITDTGRVVMNWRDTEILNLSSEFLNSGGVRQKTNVTVSASTWKPNLTEHSKPVPPYPGENTASLSSCVPSPCFDPCHLKTAWLKTLSDLNVCSKKSIAGRFDMTAGAGTVFAPYGGVYQRTPEQGLAMRLPLLEGETDFGTLMTVGYDPAMGLESPFHAAMYAVIESVMKIAAMGGDYRKIRLSFQEYFEKPTSEKSWGKPYAALMGAFLAQDELGIPSIGGKDSMSGSFKDINVPPSLISFAVVVADTTKLVSRAFKAAGNNVYLLKAPVDETGIPGFNALRRNLSSVYTLAQYGCIKSASVVGAGGIAATISEMAFGNGIGFTFDSRFKDDLFTPQYASILLELSTVPKDIDGLRDEFILVGVTSSNRSIDIDEISITLDEAQKAWEGTLNSVFPSYDSGKIHECNNEDAGACDTDDDPLIHDGETYEFTRYGYVTPEWWPSAPAIPAKPKVLIPVFPGSLGEYELEKQFRNVGAEVKTLLFRTRTAGDINDSYSDLAEAIKNTDILAIPSGMSAGGEPDGCSKLITMVLRHNDVKNAINELVGERKGLVLGLGEGFKALLKTGLIQTGSIQDTENGDVILTKHPTNRYHCTLKTVKIEESAKSPWLAGMAGEIETIPVSGLDSEVTLSEDLYKDYMEKGQIVSRYLEAEKNAPGSIEAMTSANGLILGRVGLVENLKKGLYTNVFNAKKSKIFANAVKYFRVND